MRALVYDAFGALPTVETIGEPRCPPDGVVLAVRATGLCRSDWHAWQGHDPSVRLPHVPGHEYAGVLAEIGAAVTGWAVGDRVTVPFVCACGGCDQCAAGEQQICDNQVQPGFDLPGSFAEFVAVPKAVVNLVRLPESLDFTGAAALGCRFATAYRAVVEVGEIGSARRPAGSWVAVHGCGGVGLSAIEIAVSRGARVLAVDPSPAARELAREFGATVVLDGSRGDPEVLDGIRRASGGGVHVSIDAYGSAAVLHRSVAGLRKRGRHVQVGLLAGAESRPALDGGALVGRELEITGSHGMAARSYAAMLADIESGLLHPERLVLRTLDLAAAGPALAAMDSGPSPGVTVIVP